MYMILVNYEVTLPKVNPSDILLIALISNCQPIALYCPNRYFHIQ